jgi:hypothetical protein
MLHRHNPNLWRMFRMLPHETAQYAKGGSIVAVYCRHQKRIKAFTLRTRYNEQPAHFIPLIQLSAFSSNFGSCALLVMLLRANMLN